MRGLRLKSLVESDDQILIAALLEREKPLDWHVREGMPIPNEQTWTQMITKVQIMMSMVKNTKGYLGEFEHVCVKHELGVVYLFPAGMQKVLCIVTRPEADNRVVTLTKQFLLKM